MNETEFTFIVLLPSDKSEAGALNQFPLAVDLTTLLCAPPSGNEVILIVIVWASPVLPSPETQEVNTCVHVVFGPSLKRSQSPTTEVEGCGTQSELTPLTLKASNSISPLEN